MYAVLACLSHHFFLSDRALLPSASERVEPGICDAGAVSAKIVYPLCTTALSRVMDHNPHSMAVGWGYIPFSDTPN